MNQLGQSSPSAEQDTELTTCTEILRQARTIAFVGLSDKPERYSHKVAQYFAQKGYAIIPVNPTAKEILGTHSYASLQEIPQSIHLDIVALYRNSNEILSHIQEVLERGNCGTVWLAEGVHNHAAEQFAKHHGIQLVTDKCIMKVDIQMVAR